MNKKVYFFIFSLLFIGCNLKAQNTFSGLPLEVSASPGNKNELVIYLTGDGGWNNFSRNFTTAVENKGFGVVALNTREYFWNQKSPEGFAKDIEKLAGHYMQQWNKTKLILIGYSFGADVASFLPQRFSPQLKNKVENLFLLSPSASTDFVIRLRDMLVSHDNLQRQYKTQPEIVNAQLPVVCIFGKDENLILKDNLKQNGHLKIYSLPGDHEYQENYDLLSSIIFKL